MNFMYQNIKVEIMLVHQNYPTWAIKSAKNCTLFFSACQDHSNKSLPLCKNLVKMGKQLTRYCVPGTVRFLGGMQYLVFARQFHFLFAISNVQNVCDFVRHKNAYNIRKHVVESTSRCRFKGSLTFFWT